MVCFVCGYEKRSCQTQNFLQCCGSSIRPSDGQEGSKETSPFGKEANGNPRLVGSFSRSHAPKTWVFERRSEQSFEFRDGKREPPSDPVMDYANVIGVDAQVLLDDKRELPKAVRTAAAKNNKKTQGKTG
jgi:hypothetical protein